MRLPMLAAMLAALPGASNTKKEPDERGLINLGGVLGIAGVIIGAVVSIILIAALLPTFLDAVSDVTGAFNDANTTTGDDTADSLLPIFGLLVAFAGLFAIVGLVFLAVRLRRGG